MPKTRSGKKSTKSSEADDEDDELLETQLPPVEEEEAPESPAAAASPDQKQPAAAEEEKEEEQVEPATKGQDDNDKMNDDPVKEEEEEEEEDDGEEEKVEEKDQNLYDLIDYHEEMIIQVSAPESRKKHWEALKYFLHEYPLMDSKQFGRLYVRLLLCELLMDVGSGPIHGKTVEEMKRSLVTWHRDTWQVFMDSLTDAKKACLRRDSGVKVLSAAVKESSEIDPDKAEKPCFKKGYKYPFRACQLNQILSPLRFKLEKQLMENKTGAPKVSASKVETLFEEVSKAECPIVQKYGMMLFLRKEGDDSDSDEEDDVDEGQTPDEINPDKHQPVLKNLEDLAPILSERPYSFDWLVGRIEKAVRQWDKEIIEGTHAVLYRRGYHLPVSDGERDPAMTTPHKQRLPYQTTPQSRRKELSSLKRGRAALREDHGEDPLEESRQLAEKAKRLARVTRSQSKKEQSSKDGDSMVDGGGGGDDSDEDDDTPLKGSAKKGKSSYEEKRTKGQLGFDDSDEDDENTPKRAKLSRVPTPSARASSDAAAKKRSGMTYYYGPPPDEGVFDELGNVRYRIPWSEAETNCIVSALKSDPTLKGRWVAIKSMYGHILRNRTTIQIKDKYRNMLKTGDSLDFMKTAPVPQNSNDDVETDDVEE